MRRADRFTIPTNWKVMFNDVGVNLQAALGYADLPVVLFEQPKIQLTTEQYFQLWCGIDKAAKDQGIEFALKLAQVMSIETFDVPIFAAICSPNLNSALKRLQEYKPLIGPMILALEQTPADTQIEISCYGYSGALPLSVNLTELVFFTQLTRLATRQHVEPIKVVVPQLPDNTQLYEEYFGCQVTQGTNTQVVFTAEDARIPFLTDNQLMLKLFEGDIRQKLDALNEPDTLSKKVYERLMSLLPSGESSIDVVASQLAMSKRTLQRKLSVENNSYQSVLNQAREDLASYYLNETELPLTEISFLLGFQETNSFTRAYTSWAGKSPAQVRSRI
ncbi:AraC family transcriptional regulator [Vibrio ulleungensis]|uniref:AraC family transcriptional regulator ligand-binding domain-containing protein n=1 Tax=Vibrio ulleungensis TaxID=2807619 RepID=A0ABS2HJD9_9VIBR|nr:AraC family transcriptional regulator [Vibrio ulleungensis]MBM7037226.1 AraC family transcriptional regulator ligand-binding domain-containing protein [Vibrio ulleungensis]